MGWLVVVFDQRFHRSATGVSRAISGISRGHFMSCRKQPEEESVAEKAQTYNGYCVKCKEKRDYEGTVEVSKSGMKMAKGKCPVCGTTVNRILGKA